MAEPKTFKCVCGMLLEDARVMKAFLGDPRPDVIILPDERLVEATCIAKRLQTLKLAPSLTFQGAMASLTDGLYNLVNEQRTNKIPEYGTRLHEIIYMIKDLFGSHFTEITKLFADLFELSDENTKRKIEVIYQYLFEESLQNKKKTAA